MTTFRELVDRGVLAIGDGYRAKNEELGDDGPIFLRSGYLQERGWELGEPDRLARTPLTGFGPRIAQINDTVLTTKGNSLGRLGLVNAAVAGAVYSPHLSYWRSLQHGELLPRYLYYWAHSPAAQNQIKARSESTDMAPYLSLLDQLDLKIDLPSIDQQKLVSDLLGSLDDKIEQNERTAETLEAMARAIFTSWFVNFDPVHAKANGRPTGLPDEVATLFPDCFGDGGLPAGWKIQHLNVLLRNVVERVQPSTHTVAKPYIPIDAIAPRSLTGVNPKPGIEAQSSLVTFVPDDILFGAMRPYFHKVALAPFAGTTRTTVFVLRPHFSNDLAFALLLASEDSTIRFATSSASGSTIPYAVWDGSLASMEAVVPPPELRCSFQSLVLPMLRRAQASHAQSRLLEGLRDNLLPKLISGELRIADAEKKVSAA